MIPVTRENRISITKQEFNDIMDLLQYWTTSFREGCSEKERMWLQRIINLVGEIRARPEITDRSISEALKAERERTIKRFEDFIILTQHREGYTGSNCVYSDQFGNLVEELRSDQ